MSELKIERPSAKPKIFLCVKYSTLISSESSLISLGRASSSVPGTLEGFSMKVVLNLVALDETWERPRVKAPVPLSKKSRCLLAKNRIHLHRYLK